MHKGRVEAFSDGVLAIIITIMVLELKVPHGDEVAALMPVLPIFLSYVLSFVYIGIYWNNHHHLFQTVKQVRGSALWANLHLLFWLSLIPFTTGWAGENHFTTWPVALYGINLFLCGFAYSILSKVLIKSQGRDSVLAKAIGDDRKGNLSVALYLIAIAAAFWQPFVAIALYSVVAIIWIVPDKRIEKALQAE